FCLLLIQGSMSSKRFPSTTLFRSADYWEARLEEEIERREAYVPPEPESRHPSAARALDAAWLLCSLCDAPRLPGARWCDEHRPRDRKSTRLNSSHVKISYAVFCLK